jgi:hypothetical protein
MNLVVVAMPEWLILLENEVAPSFSSQLFSGDLSYVPMFPYSQQSKNGPLSRSSLFLMQGLL